ncbi:MAG: ATP-dependent protease subunit HslV [Alphaproteobacteria bacterium]|nr:MAG: ATP-dependent protease subunit HslV [Alphaproteobacteria bacterium]
MWDGTTIVCVRRNNKVAIACDGQITLGEQIMKNSANKLRVISVKNKKNQMIKVLLGFAGSTCDAIFLYEELEAYIRENIESYDLEKIVVQLSKKFRQDAHSKKQAMMIVADKKDTFIMDGMGNAIRPENFATEKGKTTEVSAIGSGGAFALSAARALTEFTDLPVEKIAHESLIIAGEICIHTNTKVRVEKL